MKTSAGLSIFVPHSALEDTALLLARALLLQGGGRF